MGIIEFHAFQFTCIEILYSGEQVHILACLSASEQEGEVITPFKFSAVMSKNGMEHGTKRDNAVENGEASYKGETSPQKDISDGGSLLRTEDQKRKTKTVLQRFKNSHFFVRFTDSGDALWSRRITRKLSCNPSRADAQTVATMSNSTEKHLIGKNGMMNQGNFDVNATGGMARNFSNCFSLTNGDIVVCITKLMMSSIMFELLPDDCRCRLCLCRVNFHSFFPKEEENFLLCSNWTSKYQHNLIWQFNSASWKTLMAMYTIFLSLTSAVC